MIRIAFLLSVLFCIAAGNVRAHAADHKAHCGFAQQATGNCAVLIADDVDDEHALIKRNVHFLIPAETPDVFRQMSAAHRAGRVHKESPRSILTRICVLRL